MHLFISTRWSGLHQILHKRFFFFFLKTGVLHSSGLTFADKTELIKVRLNEKRQETKDIRMTLSGFAIYYHKITKYLLCPCMRSCVLIG